MKRKRESLSAAQTGTIMSPAIPVSRIIGDINSTAGGKKAWDKACRHRKKELAAMLRKGAISQAKYGKLIAHINKLSKGKKS